MRVLRSLKYALKGIIYAIKNERNMRIHTTVAGYVLVFSAICGMNAYEYAILILTISLVIMGEMFNSAVENLIDLCAKEYNATAKAAKDIAAGAVLILAFASVAVGLILFTKEQAYTKLWAFFCVYPFAFVAFIFSAFTSYFYIFVGPAELKNKLKNAFKKLKSAFIIKNMDGNSNEK